RSLLPSPHSVRLLCSPPPAPTPTPSLSLHDALPISPAQAPLESEDEITPALNATGLALAGTGFIVDNVKIWNCGNSALYVNRRQDRKSTRLNSSHVSISYAVFCLKKKTDANTVTGSQ